MIYRWIFPRTIKWYSNIRETGSVLKYVLFFLIDHLKRTLHRRLSAEKKTRLFQNKIIPFSVWFRSNNIRYENKSKRNFWEHRLSFFFFWTFIFYFATGIKTKKKNVRHVVAWKQRLLFYFRSEIIFFRVCFPSKTIFFSFGTTKGENR